MKTLWGDWSAGVCVVSWSFWWSRSWMGGDGNRLAVVLERATKIGLSVGHFVQI